MPLEKSKIVIVGQGYVGLPLAQAAVSAGYSVVGLDLDVEKVTALNNGKSRVDDISDAQVGEMILQGYRASSSGSEYADADVIVICVPTPLGDGKTPDLTAVRGATSEITRYISSGTLVILESTTYPGTTATEIQPKLEEAGFEVGRDLFLAFSPERIDPGNSKFGIKNTPKVVGADDSESLRRAVDFYGAFIDEIVPVSGTAEAELTKLLENTYRHVNIALVNELAVFCRELDIDIWEVIRAASTKPFGFQAFYPGPGVGGHCIPIDPSYLSYKVRHTLERPFRFIELAEEVNSTMPGYIVSRSQRLLNNHRKSVNGSRILLLGVTYKPGISDTRESPAVPIAKQLIELGAEISFYDPFVTSWDIDPHTNLSRVIDLRGSNQSNDLTILLQPHQDYDVNLLADEAQAFFDTRGVSSSLNSERL